MFEGRGAGEKSGAVFFSLAKNLFEVAVQVCVALRVPVCAGILSQANSN